LNKLSIASAAFHLNRNRGRRRIAAADEERLTDRTWPLWARSEGRTGDNPKTIVRREIPPTTLHKNLREQSGKDPSNRLLCGPVFWKP
jgi:hypothetical protein